MVKYKSILISGFFNVIHPGYIRLLRFAINLCNRLVVCIYSDTFYSESKVKISKDLRLENIKSLSFESHQENNEKIKINHYDLICVKQIYESWGW